MKYPGIPPAGSADGGWAVAGSDLALAVEELRDRPDPQGRIRLAEVHRRRFDIAAALEVVDRAVREVATGSTEEALLWVCRGHVRWTCAQLDAARSDYDRVLRSPAATSSPELRLAALLGVARCARVRVQRGADAALRDVEETALAVTEPHLLADVDREQAAWDLLRGDHQGAMDRAERALAVHEGTGDQFLVGYAQVLRARALNAAGQRDEAAGLLRHQVRVAHRIDSVELRQVASVYLGQFLQRGVAPDSAEWHEAEEVLTRLLEVATDPFTEAEALLPLAQLHTAAGMFAEAEAELDRYGELYTALGGNALGSGNLWKARGRLEMARLAGRPRRAPSGLVRLTGVLRDLVRARRDYARMGFVDGVRSVDWHLDLVGVLATGRPPRTGLQSSATDDLGRAREGLLAAEFARRAGSWAVASREYAAAEAAAVRAGSTLMAAAASSGAAVAAHAVDDGPTTLAALRRFVDQAEGVRRALAVGPSRHRAAATLREQYERGLLMAARCGDGALALELVERLRTEQLAGTLRATRVALPPAVTDLLRQLDEINAALAEHDPQVRSGRPAPGLAAADLTRQRRAVHEQLSRATSELFSTTYGAEPVQAARVDALDVDVLAAVPLALDGEDVVVTVWRPTGDRLADVTVTTVGSDLRTLRRVLTDPGGRDGRLRLSWPDLRSLRPLLPPRLIAAMLSGTAPRPLAVVATDWLWTVPFAAIPLDDDGRRLLVDGADIVLAPSLRFLTALRERPPLTPGGPRAAVSFAAVDDGVDAPELRALDAFPGGHQSLDADGVRPAFLRGGRRWSTAVLAAHGNSEPGLAHAVVVGHRAVLSAADFVDGVAEPSDVLSLASCHSGRPRGDDPYEPLGLATAALVAGTRQVLSSHFELDARGGTAPELLARVYTRIGRGDDAATALGHELRDPDLRRGPHPELLYRWAVLTVVGTHDRPTT